MILINLLPHREAARKLRRDIFNVSLGASALAGGLIAVAIFLWFQAQISVQQGKNGVLETEIKKLEAQIKEIAGLEAEISALSARQQAVEDLQADRNMPVYLLTELVKQLPDGVYITSMKQDGQLVSLVGVAQSNERISELLRNLASGTPWFTKPELIEIVGANMALGRDSKRVANFTLRVRLLRSSEAEKALAAARAASAASSPASAPAAKK